MPTSRRTAFDLSRRRLLLAGAGGLVLAACGGSDDDGVAAGGDRATSTTAGGATAGGATALTLIRVFSPEQPAGTPLRLPLAFADAEGVPTDDVPEQIEVGARGPSGTVLEPLVVPRRGAGIPSPYFPYQATLDEVGTWELAITAGGAETATAITVRPPHELPAVPGPGEALPSIPTPTTAAPLGIDPICTATPPCPLHETSLDAALTRGLPVAMLVSTPAFCQTAICGPVLELLVDRREALAEQVSLLHVEVYSDDTARQTSPTVDALGLRYEPSLFLAGADGTVRTRLDYTFDGTELDDALAALLA